MEGIIQGQRLSQGLWQLCSRGQHRFRGVGQSEIFGLLGLNGVGKTTTLECLEGLRSPDHGTLRVAGSTNP